MTDDPARRRFMTIQAMRWAGVGLFACGMLVIYGRIAAPRALGYVLVLAGLVDALIVPSLLARRWRSPPP